MYPSTNSRLRFTWISSRNPIYKELRSTLRSRAPKHVRTEQGLAGHPCMFMSLDI